jgi:hypothetical protein
MPGTLENHSLSGKTVYGRTCQYGLRVIGLQVKGGLIVHKDKEEIRLRAFYLTSGQQKKRKEGRKECS